ncbi:MAG: IS3 family transposase [Acidobacteria bacterium]|nr:IS3 family transposase [Acidobacteriota bacterium]
MELVSRRAEVAFVQEKFNLSQRRACELVGVDRSSHRYQAKAERNVELKQQLEELARKRPRFGYRRLTALLQRQGQEVNHKRVRRLCVKLNLSVRWKKRKRLLGVAQPVAQVSAVNEEWGMDFVSDCAGNGQKLRALTIVDTYSRVSPEVEVATSIGSQRVTRTLERAAAVHGFPRRIRTDNGPEFRSRHFQSWCEQRGIEIIHIEPGKPTQNAAIESFNGRLRDECLNANWFQNTQDARHKIMAWREDYNQHRPHSALAYRTPAEFAAQFEAPAKAASRVIPNLDSELAALASASNCQFTRAKDPTQNVGIS